MITTQAERHLLDAARYRALRDRNRALAVARQRNLKGAAFAALDMAARYRREREWHSAMIFIGLARGFRRRGHAAPLPA